MLKWVVLGILLSGMSLQASEVCFMQNRAINFKEESSRSVVIETRRKSYFVQVYACFGLGSADRIAFDGFFGQRVCSGDELLIMDIFSDRILERCHIRSITEI